MTACLVNRDASPIPLRGWAPAVPPPAGAARHPRPIWCYLLQSLVLMLLAGAAPALPPDITENPQTEILARVNGEPVTRADLQRLLADPVAHWQLREELETAGADDTGLHTLALRKLIQRRLFLQQADREGIQVTGEELDQTVVALRSRFTHLEGFGMWMQTRGLDERTLFDSLREDLQVQRVIEALVADVEVDTQQVRDHFISGATGLQTGEAVRLRIIVVGSAEAAREVLEALRSGHDFSRLARQYSLGQRAARGGDTGWLDSRSLAAPLRTAVDALHTGEASHPLQRNAGEFFIIALQGRRPLPVGELEQAGPEIERRLLADMRQAVVGEWLKQQEARATIEVVTGEAAQAASAASP
ncbi:MAG TPA: SurA N-terminal domain-containing protein [Gammaproteobacteria bacterium]|nr:SurA N-terminal domain-containing protein [Gammaproteobacteria bacterium]